MSEACSFGRDSLAFDIHHHQNGKNNSLQLDVFAVIKNMMVQLATWGQEGRIQKSKPDDFWSSCQEILVLFSLQLSEMDTNGHSHCQICQQGFTFCQQWQWYLDRIWGNCRHVYNYVSEAYLSYATAEPRKYLAVSKWRKVRERVIILDIDVFFVLQHSRSWALKSMHWAILVLFWLLRHDI